MQRRQRNLKIVATLGLSLNDYEMIRGLFEAGADVFRLNMSHGTHAEIGERHRIIREVERDLGRPIGILADLQGPKLRVGEFADGPHELEEGAKFRMDLDAAPGTIDRVQLPHHEIFEALEEGSTLLINDGKVRLRVEACGADFADCVVEVGSEISNRKGVNVPDVVLPTASPRPPPHKWLPQRQRLPHALAPDFRSLIPTFALRRSPAWPQPCTDAPGAFESAEHSEPAALRPNRHGQPSPHRWRTGFH